MIDRQYKCEHFRIEELVPPEVFADRGEKAWQLICPYLCMAIDQMREVFGPIKINDWLWGGNFKESGLRIPSHKAYSPYSQHTFGRAADLKFSQHLDPAIIRKDILATPDRFPYIMSMELDTPTWLHIDTRNCDRIMTYKP
jgi:hypothetical protein